MKIFPSPIRHQVCRLVAEASPAFRYCGVTVIAFFLGTAAFDAFSGGELQQTALSIKLSGSQAGAILMVGLSLGWFFGWRDRATAQADGSKPTGHQVSAQNKVWRA